MLGSRAIGICCLASCLAALLSSAEDRGERFDRDPGWDGHNNHAASPEPRVIKQDFGYSRTAHAGGTTGEIGGFLCPAAEPAYYAKVIPAATLDDELTASGTLAMEGSPTHALVGFFNAGTLNEWRTPNSIALRVSGRGDVFYAWVEYATDRWRAGGDDPRGFPTRRNPKTGRNELIGFAAKGEVHHWSLRYDPRGNGGGGAITATIDDQTAVCHLTDGHKADGAKFNRFGILGVMKSADAGGELWMDDVTINGMSDEFAADPGVGRAPQPRGLFVLNRPPPLRLWVQPDAICKWPGPGGAGWPGLPGRLPLSREDGVLRGSAGGAHARKATRGLGARLPEARRHRQHGADRVLPFAG